MSLECPTSPQASSFLLSVVNPYVVPNNGGLKVGLGATCCCKASNLPSISTSFNLAALIFDKCNRALVTGVDLRAVKFEDPCSLNSSVEFIEGRSPRRLSSK